MDASVKFWNRTAERYAKRPIADQETYRKKLTVTQFYLRPEMEVLEFGCGTGSTALIHATMVRHYLATDASAGMISVARKKLAATPIDNLHFQVATLDDLGHQSEQFDAVLGLNILHLLKDPKTAIAQVFHLLKPGGVFVSSTACLKDAKSYLRPVALLAHAIRLAPHVTFISRQQLKSELQSAGFDIPYCWVPERAKDTCFLVAAKPAS